jgi:hypothetical protein
MNAKLEEAIIQINDLELSDEDRNTLVDMLRGIMYISFFIPKKIEEQAFKCIDICIREKKKLEKLEKQVKEASRKARKGSTDLTNDQ